MVAHCHDLGILLRLETLLSVHGIFSSYGAMSAGRTSYLCLFRDRSVGMAARSILKFDEEGADMVTGVWRTWKCATKDLETLSLIG